MSRPVEIPKPSRSFACLAVDGLDISPGARLLAEEIPVAIVYGGSTEAVMMATPADLEDFAIGFSITEGIIDVPGDIAELAVVHAPEGIELRMWLAAERATAYRGRRRRLAGPTGCGLCGIDSLAEALRRAERVTCAASFDARHIPEVISVLASAQQLNQQTRATHAAGFYGPECGLVAIREDVGRHNALDKLAGTLRRNATDVSGSAVVLTSRVSVEMVQKTAVIGAPVLIAMSAPTALAVRTAEAANVTLVAVARGRSYQVFTHSWRLDTIATTLSR